MQKGRHVDLKGYIRVLKSLNGRSGTGYIKEHVLVAEKALGRPLPLGAVIHHINGDKTDNRPCNLVICENDAYHQSLHRRQRVLEAGGNPLTDRWCCTCQSVKNESQFYVTASGRVMSACKSCGRVAARKCEAERREIKNARARAKYAELRRRSRPLPELPSADMLEYWQAKSQLNSELFALPSGVTREGN